MPSGSHGAGAEPVTRPAWREAVAWFVLFGLLTVWWTWPLAWQPHDLALHPLPDPPALARADIDLTTWILAWSSRALRTNPFQLFDTNAFHPLPNTLAFSENLVAGALLVAPVDLVFGQHAVRDHNLLVMASFVIGGAGTALLARELGTGRLAAVVAGLLFAFHVGRFAAIMHVQTLSTHWVPWAFLFLHRLLRTGMARAGGAFAICFALALLSGVYWFYYVGIALGLAIAADAACRCPAAPHAHWKALGWSALAGVLTLPVMLPYARARELYALGRDSNLAWFFGGKLVSYLPFLALGGWFAARFAATGLHPYVVGPGAVILQGIALAAGAPPAAGGRRRTAMYGLVYAGMVMVSLGPIMQATTLLAGGIPGPHLLLERLIPGYGALRTPGRALHVAMLPGAMLVAFGADFLWRCASRPALRALVAVALVAVAGSETWWPALHPQPASAGGAAPPAVYGVLATQPAEGAVVELPIGAAQDARAMALSTWHWRPVVNGYSGFTPTAGWLRAATFPFPNRTSVRTLWELGVRWVIVRQAEMFPFRQQVCDQPLPVEVASLMAPRFSQDGVCLFEIVAEPPLPFAVPDRPLSLAGARITASSGDPTAMHDGDVATHWVEDVEPKVPGWVQIELSEPHLLTRAVLQLGPHFGEFTRHAQVQVSEDGTTWTEALDLGGLPAPAAQLRDTPTALSSTIRMPKTPVRFLRIVRPAEGKTTAMDLFLNWQRWGIHELQLYEAVPPPGAS